MAKLLDPRIKTIGFDEANMIDDCVIDLFGAPQVRDLRDNGPQPKGIELAENR